ncbi:ralA-binding protein 1-like [Littorina saxatilis]|uniref:Rho-GAP domain-containing protein n=1 Tax=Littorina saxatilis TaxID=31220 RepID=A0AAN9AZJ6_9CAEN
MSLESPDNEKNFPEEDGERGGLGKKRDSSRKRDGKKDKKDKGYTMFQEEESEEEIVVPDDIKSPTKAKKTKPGFKFPAKKDIFPRLKEKDEKKDKKEEKEKKKEEKEGKKVKVKDKEKKKSKHGRLDLSKPAPPPAATCENPIFGIPLALSVERNKSHDGIQLPAIVRECIDYVEECGLTCEGIYRISGVKSKVQQLKDCYNKGVPVDLVEHEPNIVASLLKQFLREMPEPVLTTTLMPKFEEASTIKNEKKKVDTFIRLINELPACNRLLLSWMIVHMTHIIELQKENKMSLQNVSIVLSPTMQISHRVLNALFTLAHQIFKDTYLKKYVPPLKPATSRWSLELPDNTGALEEELAKQESLLNQLHARLNAGRADQDDEEQLWEVQRVVTQLKRKIKFAQKTQGTAERRRKDLEVKRSSQLSDTEELHLELRQAPAPPPPATTTTTAVVETHAKEAEKMGSKESLPATDVERAEGKETPPGEKATQVSVKEEKDVKKETRKSREMKAQGDRAETKKKRKSQEVVEKQNSEEQEKQKSQDVKEKRKSEEITSGDVEAQATSEAVASEQPAETPVEPTGKVTPKETKADVTPEPEQKDTSPEEAAKSEPAEEEKESSVVLTKAEGEEGEGEGGEKETSEAVTLKASLKGAGEVVGEVAAAVVVAVVPKKVEPAVVRAEIPVRPVPTIVEEKPRGPVQVHPHLYLSQEPLQPIKAQPLKPRRERAEKTEEWRRHSAKLRELEEELLGGGSTRKEDSEGGTQNADGDKLEVGEEDDYEYDMADDEELQRIVEEEFSLRLEEEELLAIGDELRKKIETEQSEIERLQQEIQELQYLRHDSDLEEMSSASDSSYESEDEEDMNDMLSSLIQENLQLERENAEMCQKIHEERMICLSVKLQIRLLQQKQLESSQSSLLGDA